MINRQRISPFLLFVALGMLLLGDSVQREAEAQTEERCFSETSFCIAGRIREFWEENGGLALFGLPITPQREEVIEGKALQVQWFERNRLELHPENARPYDVLLGRLGVDVLNQQDRNWFTFPKTPSQDGCLFFQDIGQNICGRMMLAWRANGIELDTLPGKTLTESLALFGLPISPEQTEIIDGKPYTVQWFERARFELHPENNPPFDVLMGLLGNELGITTTPPLVTPTSMPPILPTIPPTTTPPIVPPPTLPPVLPSPTPLATPTTPPITGSGRIGFVSDRDGNFDIFVMNADGTNPVNLTNSPGGDTDPVWSYDGTRVAFVSDRDVSPTASEQRKEIYVMNADGTGQVNLTNDPENDDVDPTWSPDGSKIAFTATRSGNHEIFVMNADGTGATNLTNNPAIDVTPAWSPDGSKIAFASTRDGNVEVYVMNADGTNPVNVTNNASTDAFPDWSPDSSWLVFETQRDGNWEIYAVSADGTQQANITNHPSNDQGPAWSPDGTRIAFYSVREGGFDVFVSNADGTGATNLTRNPASDWFPAWVRGSQ